MKLSYEKFSGITTIFSEITSLSIFPNDYTLCLFFYFIYLYVIFQKFSLYLSMVNRLYMLVNRLYIIVNKLFTIINQFYFVVSNLISYK